MKAAALVEKIKRTWVYAGPPSMYEISGCKCGNNDVQWSEFTRHLWCDKCSIDFIPEHNGIFDGPIGVETCWMLGITFDRINIETGQIEPFVLEVQKND
jgi:hypothetical protein